MSDIPLVPDRPVVPSQEEAFGVLGRKRAWRSVDQLASHQGPAVYFLRQGNLKEPYQRWMAADPKGFMYIGTTGGRGMRARSEEIREWRHHAMARLRILIRVNAKVTEKVTAYELCYIPFDTEKQSSIWESYFLFSYYRYFADLPPLNRQLQYALLEEYGRGSSDKVVEWPNVSERLTA